MECLKTMGKIAYVNGQYRPLRDATVHIEDRGFQFADSVYETFACVKGCLMDVEEHLNRLEYSLSELQIHMPVRRKPLILILKELLRQNKLSDASIYLQVTRGRAHRSFSIPNNTKPTLIITAKQVDYYNFPFDQNGAAVITMPDIRWKRRDIKTTALLAQVLCKQRALESNADDAWMLDEKGFVGEGTASNAWIVGQDGVLITRPLDKKMILKGVTRDYLLDACKTNKIPYEERLFDIEEVCAAKEAFMSSTAILVRPVVSVDGNMIGTGKPGDLTRQLFEECKQRQLLHLGEASKG